MAVWAARSGELTPRAAQNRGRAARYSAMAEQASLLRQQDETLATLGQGVQRVKALAGVMNEELSEQAVILDSLDDDVNKTDSAMHTMNRKLKTLVADAKVGPRAVGAHRLPHPHARRPHDDGALRRLGGACAAASAQF